MGAEQDESHQEAGRHLDMGREGRDGAENVRRSVMDREKQDEDTNWHAKMLGERVG